MTHDQFLDKVRHETLYQLGSLTRPEALKLLTDIADTIIDHLDSKGNIDGISDCFAVILDRLGDFDFNPTVIAENFLEGGEAS